MSDRLATAWFTCGNCSTKSNVRLTWPEGGGPFGEDIPCEMCGALYTTAIIPKGASVMMMRPFQMTP